MTRQTKTLLLNVGIMLAIVAVGNLIARVAVPAVSSAFRSPSLATLAASRETIAQLREDLNDIKVAGEKAKAVASVKPYGPVSRARMDGLVGYARYVAQDYNLAVELIDITVLETLRLPARIKIEAIDKGFSLVLSSP